MPDDVRMTTAVVKVLAVFLEEARAERYGLDLMRETGLPSGTLYPILVRLQTAGWVDSAWEAIDPVEAGRPARRYYRITTDGLAQARVELAALYQQLGKAQSATAKPSLA